MGEQSPGVALFVTCLVDLFRPRIGFAAVKLLESAGCSVEVPRAQTCCGQPAYNAGARADARTIARQVIDAFEGYDYTVAPSGSCAGMIKQHYPTLFADEPAWAQRAHDLAGRTYELVSFLADVRGVDRLDVTYAGTIAYHDSCSSLRELDVREQPRRLLGLVEGLHLREVAEPEACCGFGGTFCVKYPDISNRMVESKCRSVVDTGAGTLLAGDLGCLMNMAGKLQREAAGIRVHHVAEVLAGMADGPAIGEPKAGG